MSPIRVRALYTLYPHWGAHAGIQQVCRYLDPADTSVSLHVASDSDADWPLPIDAVNARIKRSITQRGMAWYKLSDLTAEVRALGAAVTGRVDVVHYLDAEHGVMFLPGWLGRRSRVRTIGTFHQPPELLRTLVSQKVASTLDMVLVVSPTQEAFFRECLPPERVRTLLHGVDSDFFRPSDRPRSANRPFRCITAGFWMRDWTALRGVVERFGANGGVEFHVVTDRDTGLAGFDTVITHRNIDDDSLRRLYQEADVLLLPLLNATANNCLLEGIASGLPVVSTKMPSVEAYMGDAPALLIEGNEPAALANAIGQLRDDSAMRERLARESRRRAETISWARIAPDLARIYSDLARPR